MSIAESQQIMELNRILEKKNYMSVELDRRLVSVDEYYLMAKVGILGPEDKVELIRGEIINMSPIGKKHVYFVMALSSLFSNKLGDRAIISSQNPVRLDKLSEPEPDLAILEGPVHKYVDRLPTPEDVFLVVEVADSSLEKDRVVKQKLYAEAGIPEYWIVNLEEECIEVFLEPNKNAYNQVYKIGKEQTLDCKSLGFSFALSELFI